MLVKRIRLSLPANGMNLTLIRKFIDKFIEGTPFEDRSNEIKVAMSEASTNVIRHAYDDKHTSSLITIYGSMTPFSLFLAVKDTGKGLTVSEKEVEFPGDGGYGIMLMRKLCDRFTCETVPGFGTTVNLTFYRPLVPAQLKRPRTIVALAAALVLVAFGSSLIASSNALPGSSLYALRESAESIVLGLPISNLNKLDLELDFIERHLEEYERFYGEQKFGLLGKSLDQVKKHIKTVSVQYKSIQAADQYRVRWEIKKLRNRMLSVYQKNRSAGLRDPKYLEDFRWVESVKADVESATEEILAEQATGGTKI
ncbi:MAG: ATP-binding protein [Actinobacteria bacterium]|nr:ATP-binding protein [Actinomycetota bacterium]